MFSLKLLIPILWLSALGIISSFVNGESLWTFKVLKYDTCKEHPNTVIQFKNLHINRTSKDSYVMTGILDVTKPTPGPLFMGASVQKCEIDGKKCIHYANVTKQDLCEEVKNEKSDAYDLLNNTFHIINPKCPLPQGEYKIISSTYNMSRFESIAIIGKMWKANLYFFGADKKTVHSCVYFEILIEPKNKDRNRDKSKWAPINNN